MGTAIDFQKQMSEIVYINLPGPKEPTPGMSGGELLHGFLAEIKTLENTESKQWFEQLCMKWYVHYKESRG